MKKLLIILLSTFMVLSLTGCGNDKKKEENKPENNNQQRENENIEIVVGKKEYPIKLNGKARNVRVEYRNDSQQSEERLACDIYLDDVKMTSISGAIYLYAKILDNELEKSEIFSLLKTNPNYNYEYFKDDFKVYSVKGNDKKDYLVVLVPKYGEGPTDYYILIANDSGKFLGSLYSDNSTGLKLHGNGSKYYDDPTDEFDWSNYFYIGSDKIYYVLPDNTSNNSNGKQTMNEYAVTIDNDKLTFIETGKTYTATDIEGATDGSYITLSKEIKKDSKVTIKNPGCLMGKEEYTVKLNGENKTLKIEYYNYDKKEYTMGLPFSENHGPYYITYKFYIDDVAIDGLKAINSEINVYDNDVIEKLKDADGTTDYIKGDLNTEISISIENPIILKGDDKEYLVILVNLPGEAHEQEMIFVSDTTGLLGELYIDEECTVLLSDNNANKKYNPNGYTSIIEPYYISNDKIEYFKPTSNMYDKNGEVDCSRKSITFDEYVITIKAGKLLNTKTNNQYKSTYCEGASDASFTMFYAK